MDADPAYIIQHLRSIIIHSLDTFNLSNAEFSAERLVATVPDDPEAIYLYSMTLYRQQKYKAAFNQTATVLRNHNHLGCAYIYARLCLHLHKYKEGVYRMLSLSHLYNSRGQMSVSASSVSNPILGSSASNAATGATSATPGPPPASFSAGSSAPFSATSFPAALAGLSTSANSSTGSAPLENSLPYLFYLPAQRHMYEANRSMVPESSAIYHLLGDLYRAQGDHKNSLLNYQMALQLNPFDFEAFQELAKACADVSVNSVYKFTPPSTSVVHQSATVQQQSKDSTFHPTDHLGVPNPFATTPRLSLVLELSTPRPLNPSVPDAPLRRSHGVDLNEPRSTFLQPLSKLGDNKTPTGAPRALSYVRKRLEASHTEPSRSLKRTNSSGLLTGSLDDGNAALKEIEAADAYLRRLYAVFAKLSKCFYKYDCYKAIRILESLPENERETPWVLSKLGRLHYEIVNYKQSRKFFVRLRQLDRTRLEDMEYYSTLLWHLHKKVELTYLANELHDIDSTLAITWCVMGNLFSLSREADEAIKCFNKSLAINPKFTYAYTLKGHEYFGSDNYEKSLDCFRYSLLLDPRHYNALYGIGMVYINLGEYQKADYHFRKAVSINPINTVLICCVGMVLEKLGKKMLALRQYELANKLQPLNALPIFKKALLLFSMQQIPQAIKHFEEVRELAPNEASVHYLLGQLYKIQQDKFQAIREFTIALNLDPKGNYLIREAMESLNEND